MDWGLENRISRIIQPKTGRTVMLAVDHGYFLGPTTGLEVPRQSIMPLVPYADSLMLTRGVLRTSIDPKSNIPIVLRVSGGASILKELSNEVITTSIEDAIHLNVAAVTCSIFIGGEYERQSLQNLAQLVNQTRAYGIPVLAVTAVGMEMVRDSRYLSLSCRIAAEIGADFVKTYYCEGFEKIVKTCPVPIIVAGGKKIPEAEALQLAFNAVSRGAIGVDMGRNIFQSESPIGMIRAVRKIVHEGATVDQALEFFHSFQKENIEGTNS